MMNETNPITAKGYDKSLQSFIPIHTNEIPTAKASILVATARIEVFLFLILERFHDHAYAQKAENGKSDPMVDALYQVTKITSPQPTEKRVESLKKSEKERH